MGTPMEVRSLYYSEVWGLQAHARVRVAPGAQYTFNQVNNLTEVTEKYIRASGNRGK